MNDVERERERLWRLRWVFLASLLICWALGVITGLGVGLWLGYGAA